MTRSSARRVTRTLLAAGCGLAVVASLVAAAPGSRPRAPFDQLPVGRPPTTVPYAMGTTVYYAGRTFEVPMGGGPARYLQFRKVAAARGIVVLEPGSRSGHVVGRLSPTLPYAVVAVQFSGTAPFDVTAGGLVAMPGNGEVRQASSRRPVSYWTRRSPGCYGSGYGSYAVEPAAAGYRVLQRETWTGCPGGDTDAVYLWYPGYRPMQLPSTFEAVGRLGVGWLGNRVRTDCWDVVPSSAPLSRGRRVCSMTTPLVSADGAWAAVVQRGRLRAVQLGTGRNVPMDDVSVWGALEPPEWSFGVRDAIPAAWETSDTFIVTARYDGALALLRCSASKGRCERVVRASAEPGVSWIATERGWDVDGLGTP